MIATLWANITARLKAVGYALCDTEESLQDKRYILNLDTGAVRSPASTTGHVRAARTIKVRLQFKDRRDQGFDLTIAQEVERVVAAIQPISASVFDDYIVERISGGRIASVGFVIVDTMT